jgi:hypothetical protein
VFGTQMNVAIPSATNETRAVQGQPKAREDVTLVGVSDMGHTIVEELATLVSLALFLSMVAIWAQVIGIWVT